MVPSLAVRGLRAAAPLQQSTVPTVTTSSGQTIPVDKYFDGESLVEHQARVRHDDPSNRTFNYTMIGGARFMGASAARLLAVKFLASLNPAADVLALASLEVSVHLPSRVLHIWVARRRPLATLFSRVSARPSLHRC